jgi:hypothetical protein
MINKKAEKVRQIATSLNLTAYRISQGVSISIPTISAILNNTNKNTKDETLNELLIYLAKATQGEPPKNQDFSDYKTLIVNEVIPKLDAILAFIEYTYPEFILKNINNEREKLDIKNPVKS